LRKISQLSNMPSKKTTKKSTRKTASKAAKKSSSSKSTTTSKSTPPPRKAGKKRASNAKQKAKNSSNGKDKKGKSKKPKKSGNIFIRSLSFSWKLLTAPSKFIEKKSKKWSKFNRLAARLFFPPIILGFFAFIVLCTIYITRASFVYDKELVSKMPSRSVILDRNGEEIGVLHGANRFLAKYEDVSDNFIKALIAREDARFYNHSGVDLKGLARSVHVLLTKGSRQGGSTLSMQLAENSFDYSGKSFDGKFLEMALARKIESDFSKQEILEMYMNRIFWGGSIHGIESASRTYFEKSAAELTLGESAMLAGIISAPNAFTPFRHLDRAIKKRDITLRSMVQYKFITQAEADAAMAEPIHIRPPEKRMNKKSYVMSTLRRELDIILEENNIQMGGLTIKTTLDNELQKQAVIALHDHLSTVERQPSYIQNNQTHSQYNANTSNNRGDPQYVQGALVCIENHTGGIVSIVGGRNPYHSEYNRAIHAKRQVGSIFKPFVYLTAFDKGMNPNQYISDNRIYRNEITGAARDWSPKNSDNTYRGSIKISDALALSRNTPAVRIGNFAGLHNVRETAQKAGFNQDIPKQPSIYLGSFVATPLEVATAYTAFPNDCIVYRPFLIQEILDEDGKVVYKGPGIIGWNNSSSKFASRAVSNILEKVTSNGTAKNLRSKHGFYKPAAGKTGTTNDSRDGWYAGYTSRLTCAVWVGMDDNSVVHRGATGASLALPIWANYMKKADIRYPASSLRNRAIIVEPNNNEPPRAVIVE